MSSEEGNKLIAEFCGFKIIERELQEFGSVIMWVDKNDNLVCDFSEIPYHTSWDWLMPVVEKIRNFKDGKNDKEGFTFGGMSFNISDHYPRGSTCHILGKLTILHVDEKGIHTYSETPGYSNSISDNDKPLIEIVYQSVIQFIQWYNKTQNQ